MRLALALVIAAAFAASPALAKLPVKPVKIAVKHKGYEIDVAYPQTGNKAIDAAMADWAKREVAAFKDEAAGNDNSVGAYTLDIRFEIPRNDGKMFAVVFTESNFTGGAHPNTFFNTMNFLMPDGWRVYLPEIFTEDGLKQISQRAIASLQTQLKPDQDFAKQMIETGASPAWNNFSDFELLPDTLDIHYPPYNVAAYVYGPQETKIALARLKPYMRPDWRAPAASFDCAKAKAPVEKAICSDALLARLDRQVADAYKQKMGFADSDAAKKPTRDAQRAWLAKRTAACTGRIGSAGVACLSTLYEARLKVLTAPL